ncbi:hypothetical protein SAMN02745108_00547 [Fibrobacter intestinalis]|uniref:Uncharacterized protein n=1 Tax=Fibrobacter intestinalis TaxID=28122 RepID=A0A1T4KLZ8_9BACT|nr:hypothetical protein SAMN02745108_00547 [Fibrobacter intestinalis]
MGTICGSSIGCSLLFNFKTTFPSFLSLREYLNYTLHTKIKPVPLSKIITNKFSLPESIKRPIPLWMECLKSGYYPFFHEDNFYTRLDNVVNQTLEVDIPTFANMNAARSVK